LKRTRLQEVEQLIDNNLALVTEYSKRAAELMGSVRILEKERDKLVKKNKGVEIVRCKDCVKLNRYDCPMCYIENKTLQFAEVKPNFYCGAGKLTKEYNRTIDDIVEGKGLKPLNSKEG
jgi:hypothetical protein